MNIFEYATLIVFSPDIESKLLSPRLVNNFELSSRHTLEEIPPSPERDQRISFSSENPTFPSKADLKSEKGRAQAIHFFANHELLAIEMMATAILRFPLEGETGKKFRRGLLATISDEQKHFYLYRSRIRELGADFGDLPLNDFFWRQFLKVKDPETFYAVVALTFESANLDFALYYRDLFKSYGDERSSAIMQTVLQDEISHVRLGQQWIREKSESEKLWEIYRELLPEKISPARAKGMIFNREARIKAGLGSEFVESLQNYQDPKDAINRREWK